MSSILSVKSHLIYTEILYKFNGGGLPDLTVGISLGQCETKT